MSVPAFKEWAVIVHALLEGEQVLDVRKGGLSEDGRQFGLKSTRVWLYPTAEHQRPELLKPSYRRTVDLAAGSPVGKPIRIDGWADIVGAATVTDPEQLVRPRLQARLDPGVRRVAAAVEEAAAVVGARDALSTASSSRSRSRGATSTAAARPGSTCSTRCRTPAS